MPVKAGNLDFVQINGKPYYVMGYTADSAALLPQANRSGPVTYADRVGEETSAQATWHKGFGRGEIRAAQTFVRSADVADMGRYHYSQGVDARARGQLILGPSISQDVFASNAEKKWQFIEFNGVMLAIGTRYVHSLAATTWTSIKDMGASAAAVNGCATIFGGKLYVADGNSVVLSYDGTTWANAFTGMTKPILCAAVGTTLWILSNKNQLQSSTDGSTLATAVSVGSGVDIATALLDYSGFPHIAKPDGLYEYDGQNVWNVYPELGQRKNAANGQGATVARGQVFLPFGPQVVGYSADLIIPDVVNLMPDRVQVAEARGKFLGFWPDSDFLWGLFQSQSNNYYITSYDFNPASGQGWHQVTWTPGVNLGTGIGTSWTAIGIQESVVPPIMLVAAFGISSQFIQRFSLAINSVNPYVDSTYLFGSTGDIWLSQEADDFDDVQKSYISLVLDTAGCTAGGINVVVKYAVDGGSESTLATITTNGSQELFFPAGTTGKRMALHLTLNSNDSTKTPQVGPIARRYKRRFKRVAKWTLDLDCARRSSNVTQDPLTAFTNLITAANTVDSVAFVDIDGTSYQAFVESVDDKTDPNKQDTRHEKIVRVELTQKRTS